MLAKGMPLGLRADYAPQGGRSLFQPSPTGCAPARPGPPRPTCGPAALPRHPPLRRHRRQLPPQRRHAPPYAVPLQCDLGVATAAAAAQAAWGPVQEQGTGAGGGVGDAREASPNDQNDPNRIASMLLYSLAPQVSRALASCVVRPAARSCTKYLSAYSHQAVKPSPMQENLIARSIVPFQP